MITRQTKMVKWSKTIVKCYWNWNKEVKLKSLFHSLSMKKKIVGMEIELESWNGLKMYKIGLGVNGNNKKRKVFQKRPNKTDKGKNMMMNGMVVEKKGMMWLMVKGWWFKSTKRVTGDIVIQCRFYLDDDANNKPPFSSLTPKQRTPSAQ